MVRRSRSAVGYIPAAQPAPELEHLLTVLAHDIRSPLHTLGISCELLAARAAPDDAAAARHLGIIQYTIRQIDRLVGDVLAMESLRVSTEARRYLAAEVGQALTQAVDDHRALAEEGGVALRMRLPDEICFARIDHASLLRVLANLLTNAIRNTPAGGVVELGVRRTGDEVCFAVRDTGVGIQCDRLVHVLAGARHCTGGAVGGFGLFIVRSIVEACGGRLEAESTVGGGSCFGFTLPLALCHDRGAGRLTLPAGSPVSV